MARASITPAGISGADGLLDFGCPTRTEWTASQHHMSRVTEVQHIRSRFPALQRRHNGQVIAYFDGPGGTQVPRSVADAVGDYLLHHNANTHWVFPTSQETDEAIRAARRSLADWVGGSPEEI